MASRIKVILPRIISESYSAFIKGRQITNNVFIAYELIHKLKNKRTGRKGFMAMKLDMSKAYDRIEWQFVLAIMHNMGFSDKWIHLV